jgi:hypothetical protein
MLMTHNEESNQGGTIGYEHGDQRQRDRYVAALREAEVEARDQPMPIMQTDLDARIDAVLSAQADQL